MIMAVIKVTVIVINSGTVDVIALVVTAYNDINQINFDSYNLFKSLDFLGYLASSHFFGF